MVSALGGSVIQVLSLTLQSLKKEEQEHLIEREAPEEKAQRRARRLAEHLQIRGPDGAEV